MGKKAPYMVGKNSPILFLILGQYTRTIQSANSRLYAKYIRDQDFLRKIVVFSPALSFDWSKVAPSMRRKLNFSRENTPGEEFSPQQMHRLEKFNTQPPQKIAKMVQNAPHLATLFLT